MVSGVKPDEKKKFIGELQKSGNIVTMVGDGINDAAALATAHIGVAMGGGVGAASEVSSIVLMGNRLSQVLSVSILTVSVISHLCKLLSLNSVTCLYLSFHLMMRIHLL